MLAKYYSGRINYHKVDKPRQTCRTRIQVKLSVINTGSILLYYCAAVRRVAAVGKPDNRCSRRGLHRRGLHVRLGVFREFGLSVNNAAPVVILNRRFQAPSAFDVFGAHLNRRSRGADAAGTEGRWDISPTAWAQHIGPTIPVSNRTNIPHRLRKQLTRRLCTDTIPDSISHNTPVCVIYTWFTAVPVPPRQREPDPPSLYAF